MADSEKYSWLLYKHLQESLSAEEAAMLEQWLAESPEHRQLLEELTSEQRLSDAIREYHPEHRQQLEGRIWKTIIERKKKQAPVLSLGRRSLFRIAAACIVALLLMGGYQLFRKKENSKRPKQEQQLAGDVSAPGSNRAMITLAGGRTIYLDSVADGELARQGNMKLTKLSTGKIAYVSVGGEEIGEVQYNKLTNPRGSKVIDITLSDGSRVWLNAGSSVSYPVLFAGNERRVSMTGEAYFEIASDKTRPFYVAQDDWQVRVLGTQFNIKSDQGGDGVIVTLLEGRVAVKSKGTDVTIKPGEQAIVSSDIQLNKEVDLEQVMAWKNGRFLFDGTGIEEALREMSKWYDVEIVYEARPGNRKLHGEISRDVPLSKVLKMLEVIGAAHFRIEGKKVYVMK